MLEGVQWLLSKLTPTKVGKGFVVVSRQSGKSHPSTFLLQLFLVWNDLCVLRTRLKKTERKYAYKQKNPASSGVLHLNLNHQRAPVVYSPPSRQPTQRWVFAQAHVTHPIRDSNCWKSSSFAGLCTQRKNIFLSQSALIFVTAQLRVNSVLSSAAENTMLIWFT